MCRISCMNVRKFRIVCELSAQIRRFCIQDFADLIQQDTNQPSSSTGAASFVRLMA